MLQPHNAPDFFNNFSNKLLIVQELNSFIFDVILYFKLSFLKVLKEEAEFHLILIETSLEGFLKG